jgi:hypothetical protein
MGGRRRSRSGMRSRKGERRRRRRRRMGRWMQKRTNCFLLGFVAA